MAVLIFAVLLCIGWLIPDHFPPWWAFHNEAPAFVGLVVALAVVWAKDRRLEISIGSGEVVLLLLMLLAGAQFLTGKLVFAGDVWLTLAYVGGFLLAWTLGRTWAAEPRRTRFGPLETLALTFAVGATLSALMAVTQWLRQEDVWGPWIMPARHTSRALANLGQPNQLSTLLLMGIVAVAILRERQLISRGLLITLIALQSVAVVLTQSRTGMLVVTVLALWCWWQGAVLTQLSRRGVLAWGGAVWLAATLYQWTGTLGGQHAAMGEQVLQPGLRPLMWKQIVEGISQSPWTGYGWLQTPAAQQAGAMKVPGLEQALYAHNHLLDLIIWLGLPLTFILLGLTAWAIWRRRRAVHDPQVVMVAAWLLPVACHAMLEFPLAYAYFLLPAGVMVGMLDHWTNTGRQWRLCLPSASALIASCLYGGMLLAMANDYLRAEEDFRVARFENRRIGTTPVEYHVPELKVLSHLGAVLQAMRLRAKPGMQQAELNLLKQTSRRFSWAPLHFRYALALGLNGKAEEATRQMQLIRGLYGEKVYSEAAADFRRLQHDEYPVLSRVQLF